MIAAALPDFPSTNPVRSGIMPTMDRPVANFSVRALASGSSGNAWLVRCPEGALLVDAGLSGRAVAQAVESVGGSMDGVGLLLLTHDHADHAQGAGVIHRRHGIPLAMTRGTWRATRDRIGAVAAPRLLRDGETVNACGFALHPVATPHDGAEPCGFVIERGGRRVGILTDLGHPFPGLAPLLATLDGVFLESNYDPAMLASGPYPESLKRRIRSRHGHLSNEEAGELLAGCAGGRLTRAVLSHLSAENNEPALALAAVKRLAAPAIASGLAVRVAPRHAPSVEMAR